MKRHGPYFGITGFMQLGEVAQCSTEFKQLVRKSNTPRAHELKFMVGVLVSSKTLAGGTNKWPGRYPRVEAVQGLFLQDEEHLLHTIHYNTDDPDTILDQIGELVRIGGPHLHALQLNMKWVNPVHLTAVARRHPNLRIILQIGEGALSTVTEPEDIYIGEAIRTYHHAIDDFLVDPSGGKGQSLDIWRAFACVADRDIPPHINPGVAGGFDAETVAQTQGLMRRLGRTVNLDAEGKLRSGLDAGDYLMLPKAIAFMNAAVPIQLAHIRGVPQNMRA